jgi:AcrR family transcriptional regulator
MSTATPSRPVRSDVRRNRDRLLRAALQVFGERGLDASVEQVAAAAGVGVGTVYRHFGSKDGLVNALFEEALSQAIAIVGRCAEAPTGWEALCRTMRVFSSSQLSNRALLRIMRQSGRSPAEVLTASIAPLLSEIIDRAKAEGAVRADFAATDMATLTHAASGVAVALPEIGPGLARRHVELLLKGIAASPDLTPIPGPLSDEQFTDWLSAVARTGPALDS